MRETVGENVIAGHAMMRRAAYQFGPLLPVGPMGQVDCGLGKNIPFYPQDLVAPTEEITATGEELVVDGVRIVFQLTPEAEAPAEMNFFFPDQGWLCTAENCTHNMHNLVPIRGAQVRDALKWSKYIDEAIRMFGDRTELSFASHHWPRWGNEDVLGYLRIQRDLYRWIHDQTMRWANHGLGPLEIAELLSLPPEFAQHSHTVGYYGHLAHNVKAVYQRYLSWYDGNPSNLWRLPPTQSGPLYVDLAGGMDALVAHAQRHFDTGAYRWVVELLAHAVNADPAHQPARLLQAAAFEQLGYQSESATFRNAFLMAAQELRHGTLPRALSGQGGYLAAMSPDQLFDAWAVRLRSEDLGGHNGRIRFEFVDAEPWTVELSHRTLHAWPASNDAADLRLRGSTDAIRQILEHRTDLEALESEGLIEVIAGNRDIMHAMLKATDYWLSNFPLVEPVTREGST